MSLMNLKVSSLSRYYIKRYTNILLIIIDVVYVIVQARLVVLMQVSSVPDVKIGTVRSLIVIRSIEFGTEMRTFVRNAISHLTIISHYSNSNYNTSSDNLNSFNIVLRIIYIVYYILFNPF